MNEYEIPDAFERLYIDVRKKENRLYTDRELAALPFISPQHPWYKEWQIRAFSCKKLIQYLIPKKRHLDILETGCGNGWLSAHLARNLSCTVTGLDINSMELEQAKRVFAHINNVYFFQGGLHSPSLQGKYFDSIVFAASVQYFPSLQDLLKNAMNRLRPNGEIYILDSYLYRRSELDAAKQRTTDYYNTLGFPEMTDYYFHHCLEELENFTFKILYNPDAFVHRLRGKKSPFYILKILPS